MYKVIITAFLLVSINSYALSLTNDAIERGINQTCSKYLGEIEKSYNLNGLNITFVHPESSALLPSLHISSQKYNNGSSTFSATLTPDEEYCYISTVLVTSVNNQSCSEISQLKVEVNPDLQTSSYADGDFTIITPKDNTYQIILTSQGVTGCSMTETRMLWPGR
ncbi:hypothetical protein ABXT44_05960 [Candidatus Pseudothioglobus sp. Uisw_041]|uniref:hypothetical protein n=1 Tax=Candidatus Pseudothioglobus sp. Uisw_041 TaxID=3230996 RepID=UPI003A86F935